LAIRAISLSNVDLCTYILTAVKNLKNKKEFEVTETEVRLLHPPTVSNDTLPPLNLKYDA